MLEKLLSDKNTIRVIEFFLKSDDKYNVPLNFNNDISHKDLCSLNEIYPDEMLKILKRLSKYGFVIRTRKVASHKFYRVVRESNIYHHLTLLLKEVEKYDK